VCRGTLYDMSQAVAVMGDKGRVVVPAALRAHRGWREGTVLVFAEDGERVYVLSAAEALARFRASVSGTPSPVDELLAERRRAAEAGD